MSLRHFVAVAMAFGRLMFLEWTPIFLVQKGF